nr:FAD-dependent oxidoreductase [Barrientosiimonas endolithica]
MSTSVGEWAGGLGFSDTFHQMFLRPLVAAVWSCDAADALRYPARSLLTFLEHHGMLSVSGSPTWRTVVGGSRAYVDRVLKNVSAIRLSSPVREVRRTDAGVEVTDPHGTRTYAGVVIATHPHQALRMLPEPNALEEAVLSAITYSTNPAQLHTDSSLLPTRRRVSASWNYRLPDEDQHGVLVTYDLTRLMRLPRGDQQRILVTLNGAHRVDPSTVLAEMTYEHPLYTAEAVAAQRLLPQLSDDRIAFAGAYHGWGFHEDGAASGLAAARSLGVTW